MKSTASQLISRWPLIAAVGGLMLFGLLFYGCDSRREVIVENSDIDARDVCTSLLQSGLAKVQPEKLGLLGIDETLDNTPDEAAEQFTQWLRRKDCLAVTAAKPPSSEGKTLLERLFGEQEADALLANRAGSFDAVHIRDAIIAHDAADNLTEGATTDLERAALLFDEVVRTITPQGTSTTDTPLMTYEAHLFGRGTAESRASLFASLLRQIRMDAVILRPETDDASDAASVDADDPWWVAVLLKDGVYLFDTDLGLPVPAAAATPLSQPDILPQPATWAQAVESPELLTKYRADAGLPVEAIPAERLDDPRVELIGPRSYWSTAMERLELSMTGDLGVLLYDPLHDTHGNRGYYRRVVDAGSDFWKSESISIWPVPDQIQDARLSLSDSQRRRLEQRIQPYLGPVEPDTKTGAFGAYRRLWQTRVKQMSGRPGAAVGIYVQIRLADAPHPSLSAADIALNDRAADEAYYWSAHAQYGMGDFAAAVETTEKYLSQGGSRADEARTLRVLALAADGQKSEAAAAVAELPETTPGLARYQWLARWWQAGNDGESDAR